MIATPMCFPRLWETYGHWSPKHQHFLRCFLAARALHKPHPILRIPHQLCSVLHNSCLSLYISGSPYSSDCGSYLLFYCTRGVQPSNTKKKLAIREETSRSARVCFLHVIWSVSVVSSATGSWLSNSCGQPRAVATACTSLSKGLSRTPLTNSWKRRILYPAVDFLFGNLWLLEGALSPVNGSKNKLFYIELIN